MLGTAGVVSDEENGSIPALPLGAVWLLVSYLILNIWFPQMGTGNNTTCPLKVAVRIRDNIGKALDRVLDTWLALNMR